MKRRAADALLTPARGGGGSKNAAVTPPRSSGATTSTPQRKLAQEVIDPCDIGPVQPALWKNVGFTPEGVVELSWAEGQVLLAIDRDFLVPRNFHESRFGPLSGLSHERRVIVAYYAGVLQPRDADAAWPAPVCRVCGDAGHRPDSCARAFCSDSVATPPPAAAGGDGSGRMHVRE